MSQNKKEVRNFDAELRVETREGKAPLIRGHAAVFNFLSADLGGFTERIALGAFDNVLEDDVRSLFNHDSNLILGRTKSNTLKLSVDERGLMSETDPPNTSYAADLSESIARGDVSQMSFGFTVANDKWEEDDEGRVIRTITEIGKLYDISAVTFPAYPDTDVALRGLEDFKKANKREEIPSDYIETERKRQIQKLKL